MSVKQALAEKDYLPILKMNDGRTVTRDSWQTRRAEMRELLEKYSYGKTPSVKVSVQAKDVTTVRYDFGGKCAHERLTLVYKTELGKGEFPIQIFTPANVTQPPVLLHIGFALAPHWYIPTEEIIDA